MDIQLSSKKKIHPVRIRLYIYCLPCSTYLPYLKTIKQGCKYTLPHSMACKVLSCARVCRKTYSYPDRIVALVSYYYLYLCLNYLLQLVGQILWVVLVKFVSVFLRSKPNARPESTLYCRLVKNVKFRFSLLLSLLLF